MSTVDKKLQIFISSTSLDLQEERQAAVDAILKTNNIPSAMEYFNSGGSTLDIIKRWIDASDIFVLILGGRYGGLDKASQKSYTQLEYEYAIEKKKPIIALVLDDSFLNDKFKLLGLPAIEVDNPHKYKEFKDIVLNSGKHCFICKNLNDISNKMTNAIYTADKEGKLIGWVSGREFEVLKKEIKELTDKNDEITNTILVFVKNSGKEVPVPTEINQSQNGNLQNKFNPKDIEIDLRTINETKTGFQLHFSVTNNSDHILTNYGRFFFRLNPKLHEDNINQIGYDIVPTNGIDTQYLYPNKSFIGYYEWKSKLEFELEEIYYFAVMQSGEQIHIANWFPENSIIK